MKILFTCGREPEYVRNEIILRALHNRYDVTSVTDSCTGSLIARSFRLLPRLLHYIKKDYDVVFIGFYGYLLVPWLRACTRCPIIFDAFMSNYDTLCFDRQQYTPASIIGRLIFQLDRLAYKAADLVLLDTATHQDYVAHTFNITSKKLNYLYVSCNESIFFPQIRPTVDNEFRILAYSSYLPLHGMEYIVRAAKILEYLPNLQFRLIGQGLQYRKIQQLADKLKSQNIQFISSVPYRQLPVEIAQASVCLAGHFGKTAKAHRVIPSKLFQFLAMAKPTISGDTPANRELITDEESYLLPVGNAAKLASAIVDLTKNKPFREHIALRGFDCYRKKASEVVFRKKLYQLVEYYS